MLIIIKIDKYPPWYIIIDSAVNGLNKYQRYRSFIIIIIIMIPTEEIYTSIIMITVSPI